jgi:transcriptional regulator GlxA family with amidase domain
MSIMHITMACGFQSACHFSKSYRDAFGVAPTRERRKQVAPLAGVTGGGAAFPAHLVHM